MIPDESLPQLAWLVGLILLSGFFSAGETALFSISKVRARHLAKLGGRREKFIKEMKNGRAKEQAMEQLSILKDLVVIIAVAVLGVLLLRRVGVPSLAGFIIAGVIVAPQSIGLISEIHEIEILAEVGVVLLLFSVGLELSFERLHRLWKPILVGGFIRVSFTVVGATAIGDLFELPGRPAIFLGFLTAISSTAIGLRALERRARSMRLTDASRGASWCSGAFVLCG
jgi:hypothetical protein